MRVRVHRIAICGSPSLDGARIHSQLGFGAYRFETRKHLVRLRLRLFPSSAALLLLLNILRFSPLSFLSISTCQTHTDES